MTARMNTTEASAPGERAAWNALTDAKTSAEIRRIAADMVGDVEPLDLTMVARGADWTEPPPRLRYRCEPAALDVAIRTAERVLLVMAGWVGGLLTALLVVL